MQNTTSPVSQAFRQLAEICPGSLGPQASSRFALTWLAAARLCTSEKAKGLPALGSLATESGWLALAATGLPVDATEYLTIGSSKASSLALAARAVAIVANLIDDVGNQPWDLLPVVRGCNPDALEPLPALSQLLFDLVGDPVSGDTLWLPFDANGTLTIQALRRGWRVNTHQIMGDVTPSMLPLLLAIEHGLTTHPDVISTLDNGSAGELNVAASHILAVLPCGYQIHKDSPLNRWHAADPRFPERYSRIEPWAIAELSGRAAKRAVFCTTQGILFSTGQDRRLRESLLGHEDGRNVVESVLAAPARSIAGTSIAPAVIVLAPGEATRTIRMVDLTASTRNAEEAEELLLGASSVALGYENDEELARLVSLDEIRATDCSFVPSRYVGKQVDVGPNAISLGELGVSVIRPSAVNSTTGGSEAVEIGIPDLGSWRGLTGPFTKKTKVRDSSKSSCLLKRGDVLLSIKGTVGKVGLIGDIGNTQAAVSQSCIALRLPDDLPNQRMTPEYLLMYLRSDEATAQLRTLEVGGVVPHISSKVLLGSLRIPVLAGTGQAEVAVDYGTLCGLESQIEDIEAQMCEIKQRRWRF